MGRGGIAKNSICRCSSRTDRNSGNSDRRSWSREESALGCFLSSDVAGEHPHPSATSVTQDSSIKGRCRTCSSRLTGSQRSLDGPWSSLGTWRQRWLRVRDWPACGEAGKRSGYRDLCREEDNKRAGKVASSSDDELFGSRRYSRGDTRMRLLPHRIRTRGGRRHSIAYSGRTRTQRRSLEL